MINPNRTLQELRFPKLEWNEIKDPVSTRISFPLIIKIDSDDKQQEKLRAHTISGDWACGGETRALVRCSSKGVAWEWWRGVDRSRPWQHKVSPHRGPGRSKRSWCKDIASTLARRSVDRVQANSETCIPHSQSLPPDGPQASRGDCQLPWTVHPPSRSGDGPEARAAHLAPPHLVESHLLKMPSWCFIFFE